MVTHGDAHGAAFGGMDVGAQPVRAGRSHLQYAKREPSPSRRCSSSLHALDNCLNGAASRVFASAPKTGTAVIREVRCGIATAQPPSPP